MLSVPQACYSHVTAHPERGRAVSNDYLRSLSVQNKPRAGTRTQISTQLLSLLHTYPFSSKQWRGHLETAAHLGWSGHLETAAHLGLRLIKHMYLSFACFVLILQYLTTCVCVCLHTPRTTCKSKFPSTTQAPGFKVRLWASQQHPHHLICKSAVQKSVVSMANQVCCIYCAFCLAYA